MNWRDYKRPQEGFKGSKGFKPLEESPLEPLKPLKPAEPALKNKRQALSRPEQQLADEAERRIDFCSTHREMKGGCAHHDITKGSQPDDRISAFEACLLRQLSSVGSRIVLSDTVVIIDGLTVGDVLRWVKVKKDIESIRKEPRLLLTCANSLQGRKGTLVSP